MICPSGTVALSGEETPIKYTFSPPRPEGMERHSILSCRRCRAWTCRIFEDEKAELEVEQKRMENLEKGKEAAV